MFFAAVVVVLAASPGFPLELKNTLGAPVVPQCTICHQTNVGGVGTVVKPFGVAMQEHGLVLEDVPSLHSALDGMRTDAVDSDGDGTIDVDEVKAGDDPNVAGTGEGEGEGAVPEVIQYGFVGCAQAPPDLCVVLGGGVLLPMAVARALARRRRA